MRVTAWLVHLNLARVLWPLARFLIYYMFIIILTIEINSPVGQEACLGCARPGFDPRRAHFVIFSCVSGRSHVLLSSTRTMGLQINTTGWHSDQI